MPRSERIAGLIARRRPLAEAADRACQVLAEVETRLRKVEEVRRDVVGGLPENDVRARLADFSLDQQLQELPSLRQALGRLVVRFRRPRIQIGLLGRAGQGKSTLLQRLSGLGEKVIPSGKHGHCTGARSVIVNDPGAERTFARIYFHDQPSFLRETVRPYFEFFKDVLPKPPVALEEFAQVNLRTAALQRHAEAGGDTKAKLSHLRRIQEELPHYERLLTGGDLEVPESEIRTYIAQEDQESRRLASYWAVRFAEIHCRFPRPDAGEVAFVDMPGLGDTGLGHEPPLVRLMAEDADLVLMVRRPDPHRDSWLDFDQNLYRVGSDALGELLPIERWMLLVLNGLSDNRHNCELLERTREDWGILVARSLTADCSDPAQALEQVFDPALGFLEEHLDNLDKLYGENIRRRLQAFRAELAARCLTGQQLVPFIRPGGGPQQAAWQRLDAEFSKQLRVQLGRLVHQFRRTRAEPDLRLKAKLAEVLDPLASHSDPTLVPTAGALQELAFQEDGWPGAVQEAMNRIRSELTHRLLGLDVALAETLGEAKRAIRTAIEAAGLNLDEKLTGPDTWSGLARRAREAGCPALSDSFEFVGDFELKYFGFIHHRIRDALDPLTPDARPLPPLADCEHVHDFLWGAVDHAVYQMRRRLEEVVLEPAMARFAMAEEFKDQSLRREQMGEEWRRFTAVYSELIWPDQFAIAEGEAGMYRQWAEALGSLEAAAARLETPVDRV